MLRSAGFGKLLATTVYRRAHWQHAIVAIVIVMATWTMPCAAQSSAFPKQTKTRGQQVAQLVAEGVTAL